MQQRELQRKALGQYFTPRWAAEAIVGHYFHDLRAGDLVIEPACGDGRFLMALPDAVEVIGVELDPFLANIARQNSGRRVITGDFLQTMLPGEVDAIIGNPPFKARTISQFLVRAHQLLRDGGRCGFILPAYIHQTYRSVLRSARDWSISTELLPRNLFPGLSMPITFTVFTKDRLGRLHGFFLYRESQDLQELRSETGNVLATSTRRGSVWRQIVADAFRALGVCQARLADLYSVVARSDKKPTGNRFWAHQIRKVLQTYPEFRPVSRGVWALEAPVQALAA